ncbi:3-oxoacyl-[acyl-carrier protein] reductase [Nocardioides zeae]|uniref:3-oxoacyl-[acyl-carrier protein] reductase n=2 Tax=Nocardioides zeae TaxID=1457234 RepID=A0AAJ1U3U4_9ACTN|nr:3-oxoacyl-ACP reductase [Nocardioides zeae]MDQ1103976.1 3-oxoacyl-[acyl-carrier protein] reductase [Nocardioides zeae]MDR6176332.1 3-oxoacyl-[acyl-carrier protein] reductase [Nocardioides zeae]MDR6210478.1 3-oxoacyl-[acyl-carrier protein] reductase [Nocardioides zeae]
MTDRYQSFVASPVGKILVKNLGLPSPVALDRYVEGAPLVDGTVLVGGRGRLVEQLPETLDALGITSASLPEDGASYKGLVFDATGLTTPEDLRALRDFFTPVLRSLTSSGRVVVLGTTPADTTSTDERIAQRALEGFTRSLGKEVGRGSTVQLVYVAPGAETAVDSTLAFLLSPKSAYVSGQVVRIGATGTTAAEPVPDLAKPLAGKVALVTGASRGIGEQIARVLHRDGATVVGVDVPQAASDLVALVKELDGDHIALDITAKDAPQRIAQHVLAKHGGVDIVVHNAGITRDKKLANMKEDRWDSVIAVNVAAPERITAELLEQKAIRPNGRVIGVASIAGIAGNVGQTNYAASKAGVIGLVEALAPELTDGITINAVAPGFIITQMTAAVPFATREVGQRLNAMAQGGLPVDVAETIAWFASPGSTAVNGNVVRVCGQMMLGA